VKIYRNASYNVIRRVASAAGQDVALIEVIDSDYNTSRTEWMLTFDTTHHGLEYWRSVYRDIKFSLARDYNLLSSGFPDIFCPQDDRPVVMSFWTFIDDRPPKVIDPNDPHEIPF